MLTWRRYNHSVSVMTASQIIALWPSAEHFAADLSLKYPSYGRVMKMRGRIPDRYWDVLVVAAQRRGINVTKDDLVKAHQVTAEFAA